MIWSLQCEACALPFPAHQDFWMMNFWHFFHTFLQVFRMVPDIRVGRDSLDIVNDIMWKKILINFSYFVGWHSIKKASEKGQKSWSGGNGSMLRPFTLQYFLYCGVKKVIIDVNDLCGEAFHLVSIYNCIYLQNRC